MSENKDEREHIILKGVIPAKITTAEEFHESLENLKKYRQRYERQTQIIHETLVNLTDYFRKHPSILEDAVKEGEGQAQIAREALESFANYLEKHPSLIEEMMKEHKQERFKKERIFDC